jgi:hypothetical protein
VELLVVIAIIGILVALLLPAIQAAREAARRTQCLDHQKNLGLALQNYHDTYKVFPMGAMVSGPDRANNNLGPSWWYGIMPFIEQRNIYDKIAATQRPGVTGRVFNAGDLNPAVNNALAQLVPEYMRCPSSPVPLMERQDGPICLPSYVGISGGCDIANGSPDYTGLPANSAPTSNRTYVNQNKGSGPNSSIVTSSGMLPPSQHINMAGCSDGTSNTMIVAEQSDWLRDTDRTISTKYHGDPGWNEDGGTFAPANPGTATNPPETNVAGGWVSGTEGPHIQVGKAASFTNTGSAPGAWTSAMLWNITTVRYKPDFKQVLGGAALPGCAQTMGHNNPLQAPHPGGLLVAFVDGSVQFISGTTDFAILLRIAIRDDGQNVTLD